MTELSVNCLIKAPENKLYGSFLERAQKLLTRSGAKLE